MNKKYRLADELQPTLWQFVLFVFNIGIVEIAGSWFHFFYAREYVDFCQRLAVVIFFNLCAIVSTVYAIETWKEGTGK